MLRVGVILVVAILSPLARAQYSTGPGLADTGLTKSREIQFKPFTVSISPVAGYDFNANGAVFVRSPQQRNQVKTASSAYAGANGSGAVNFVWPDTFLGSRISAGYIYYVNNDVQNQNRYPIDVNSTFSHAFSPRWILTANNSFVSETGTQIGTGSALPNQAQQYYQQGTYYINNFSLNNSFLIAPRLTFNGTITYGLTRYEDQFAANTSDLDQYGISVGPTYLLNSSTSVGFSIGYNRSEHPGPIKIYSTTTNILVLVDKVNRNSDTESFTVNMSHTFSARLSMSTSVGVTLTTFQEANVTGNSVNPYVAVSVGYQPSEKTTVQLSYVHSISQGQYSQYLASIQDTATLTIGYELLRRIPLTISATYSNSQSDQQFNADTAASTTFSANEEAASIGVGTSYNLTSFASANVAYIYTHVISDSSFNSYDTDQITFNVNLRF